MGKKSLILGILTFIFSWLPFLWLISPVLAVVAIVFGFKSISNKEPKGMAITGILLGFTPFVQFFIGLLYGFFAAMMGSV